MATEIENFDIGDKVKHPKFGAGTIVFRTGEGERQKVTVKFGSDVGEKKLMVSLANLKLISERPTLQAAEETVQAVPGRARLGKGADDDDDDEDAKAAPDDVEDDDDEDADDVEDVDDDGDVDEDVADDADDEDEE